MNNGDYRVLITAREKVNSNTLYVVKAEILPNNKRGASVGGQKPTNMIGAPRTITVTDLMSGVNIYDYNLQQNQTYTDKDIKYYVEEEDSEGNRLSLNDRAKIVYRSTIYSKDDIEIEFEYSNKGIKKSIKQTADNNVDERKYFDVLSCLDKIIDTSILIEKHNDKTDNVEAYLKKVYVLLGAYKKGEEVTPVQLEIKESIDNDNRLYLAVAIKESGVNVTTAMQDIVPVTIPDSSNISIQELVRKINPEAVDLNDRAKIVYRSTESEYWQDVSNQCLEIFANLCCIEINQSRSREVILKYFPELYEAFEGMI